MRSRPCSAYRCTTSSPTQTIISVPRLDYPNAKRSGCAASLLIVYCIVNPILGRLSDAIGRRKLLLFAAAGLTFMAYPIFWMLNSGSTALIVVALLIFGILVAITAVMDVILVVEVFPASIRSTGAALGHTRSRPSEEPILSLRRH